MTIIFLCFFVFTTIYIFKWKVDSHHTKEVITQIKKVINIPTKREYTMNLDNLIEMNKDTLGYIKIEGTNISYPFVQTKDNKYYLNHSFNKKYNDAGWIFMDYRNKDLNDKNVILYGHDRKDNTMFGTLKNVLKKSWQDNTKNHIITIYAQGITYYYKVFSTYHIKTEDYYITTDFKKESFSNFIKTLKKRSNYNYNIDVNKNDTILTLSTCYTEKEKVVLHAVKLNKK